MRKESIQTISDAFAYYTDCQLATVEWLALKKSTPKGEYKRHIDIAQGMCDLIRKFKVIDEGNRFNTVETVFNGNVNSWAEFLKNYP